MKITSTSCRIEAGSGRTTVWMDSVSMGSGYICGVQFNPSWHHIVIAKDKSGAHYLLAMESPEWESSIDSDLEIVQRLSPFKAATTGDEK